MDLRQLRTFVHVAELGSLSRASDRLNVAQPALSRQMRMLETELNVELFGRHGRGMVLTEAGTTLLTKARSILQQIDEIPHDLVAQGEHVRGHVSLGVPPTVGDVLAARLIEKFHARYPDVTLRVIPAFSGFLLDFLHRGEIDIAIIYASEQKSNLDVTPLIREELHLVGPASANLKLTEPVPFKTLAELNLVLPSQRHGLRVLIERHAKEYGITLNVPIEADGVKTLRDLVVRGLGHTILPLASAHPLVQGGSLTAAPIAQPILSRHLNMVQLPGKSPPKAIKLFSAMLREEIATLVNTKIWDGKLTR